MYSVLDNVGKSPYFECVQRSGLELKNTPDVYVTLELCMAAVKQNGASIEYVPSHLVTEELIRAAIDNSPSSVVHVKEKLTPELWKEVLARDGTMLYNLERKTNELCTIAVEQNPKAIAYAAQTQELADLAFKKDSSVLNRINDEFITQEMCDTVEMTNGIEHIIPDRFMTPEIQKKIDQYYSTKKALTDAWIQAVTANADAVLDIPYDELTPSILNAAIAQDQTIVDRIPKRSLYAMLPEYILIRPPQ